METEPTPITYTKAGDPLQTKYYCQVEKSQHMKVIMELKAMKHERVVRCPLRYVLVIDVSGSMSQQTMHGHGTLLERVQLFAELAVRKMGHNDYLSIVTFSSSAKIELPMLMMTNDNKLHVRNVLKTLIADGNTNLESGLLTALEAIRNAGQLSQSSRDCIILFTDGGANEGETNAKTLIANYRRQHNNLNARACIPVSAFTIGQYQPDLLIEIAGQLGSESFYWLNDEEDFEVDILIPVFLRKITNISDLAITIKARVGSYFADNKHSTQHLMVYERTCLTYFIHSLPDEASKNLKFQVQLPQNQNLNGVRIVDIDIDYLDEKLAPRKIEDYILLSANAFMLKPNIQMTDYSSNVIPLSSLLNFVVENNQAMISEKKMEEVVLKIAEQEFKSISMTSITCARDAKFGKDYLYEIDRIRNGSISLLPNGSKAVEDLQTMTMAWKSIMTAATKKQNNYALLSSMVASIATECPTSDGIFEGKQPYITDNLENKLEEEKKNLEVARRIQSRPFIDIDALKSQIRKAIAAGELRRIEEYLKEMKELRLSGYEVEDTYISHLEEENQHRYEIENVKRDLQTALSRRDFEKLEDLLPKMKELRNKRHLTFTHEDENTLKHTMRQTIDELDHILKSSLEPQHLNVLRDAIKSMEFAKKEAEIYNNFFSPDNERCLQKARETLIYLEKQRAEVQLELSQSLTQLQLPMVPTNYEQINEGVQIMEKIASLVKGFNLYQEEYNAVFEKAVSNRNALKDMHDQVIHDLKRIEPSLSMAVVPANLIPMRETVEKMRALKEASNGFENLFTPKHERELYEITTNLNFLNKKIDELEIARQKVKDAVSSRSYSSLKHAIKKANKATFIDKKELKEPRKLLSFLNPKNRCLAVKNAMAQSDIELIEEALLNMREVGVNDDELENEAEKMLVTLRKQQRKEERERIRIAREEKRRKKAMKRLRKKISSAIDSNSIEKLEQALDEFEDSGFSETKIPIAVQAKELLRQLKVEEIRSRLQRAIRRRNFEHLRDALVDADYGNYRQYMKKEYDEAKELFIYLKEMMRLRDAIANMSRSTISEVHNYPHPPKQVKKVMMSVFTILGEPAKKLKDWLYIQSLLGKLDRNSITKRVMRFQLRDLSLEDAQKADSHLGVFKLEDIEEISAVAATFYAWAKYIINEVMFFEKERDKRQHELKAAENEASENYDHESVDSDGEEYWSEASSNEPNNT